MIARPAPPPSRLMDRFGRRVTYVRLSVTDRCDLHSIPSASAPSPAWATWRRPWRVSMPRFGQEHSADLRRALRGNPTDDARLKQAMVAAMALKPRGHDFALTGQPVILRHMNVTGG